MKLNKIKETKKGKCKKCGEITEERILRVGGMRLCLKCSSGWVRNFNK